MVWTICKKELREMVRDGRLRAAGLIVLVLLSAALLLGWRNYRNIDAQHKSAQQATRQQWLGQGRKNPHSAAHYGVYAFKPKTPLSLVDPGTDPFTGVAVWLEAHKQNEFQYKPAQDATSVQRFGELTGAAVLQILVPLLLVLLGFNAWSGERELGTLRQLGSLGVSRMQLLVGKALAMAGAVSLLLLPALLAGLAALAASAEPGAMRASLPRGAAMAVSYGLYFAAFGALCLAVSAWASSSRLALVVLLGFWMLNVLIAPRTASDIARFFRPAPSAFAFGHQMEAALAQGIDGHNPADERISKLRDELLKKYNVDSIEHLPVNFAGVRLQEGENYGNKVYDAAYGRLWQTFGEQDGMRERLSLLAPGLAIRHLSMAFAGTDFPQHAHFAKHAEEYRRSIQLLMNNDLITHASNTGAYYADHSLWNQLPEFAYTAPGLTWVLERQWPSVAVLAVWFALTAAAAVVAARQLNVA